MERLLLPAILVAALGFAAVAMVAGGAPWPAVAGVAVLIAAVSVAVLFLVMALLWWPWRRRFPGRSPAEDAVGRSMQSARLGAIGGFNHCLSIATDQFGVHLRPMSPLRALSGGSISVPWDAIGEPAPHWLVGSYRIASVGTRSILLPGWCFEGRETGPIVGGEER